MNIQYLNEWYEENISEFDQEQLEVISKLIDFYKGESMLIPKEQIVYKDGLNNTPDNESQRNDNYIELYVNHNGHVLPNIHEREAYLSLNPRKSNSEIDINIQIGQDGSRLQSNWIIGTICADGILYLEPSLPRNTFIQTNNKGRIITEDK